MAIAFRIGWEASEKTSPTDTGETVAAVEITVGEDYLQGLFQSDGPLARLLEELCNRRLGAELCFHVGAAPHERTEPLGAKAGTSRYKRSVWRQA